MHEKREQNGEFGHIYMFDMLIVCLPQDVEWAVGKGTCRGIYLTVISQANVIIGKMTKKSNKREKRRG